MDVLSLGKLKIWGVSGGSGDSVLEHEAGHSSASTACDLKTHISQCRSSLAHLGEGGCSIISEGS